MKSSPPSAQAAWARSIAPATQARSRVALKVLPAAFAPTPNGWRGSGARRRCSPSLNHPNIAHDLRPRTRRVHALVMELVAGRGSLAERLIAQGADSRRRGARRSRVRSRRRSRPRTSRHRPSRPEAGQHQGARRRHREGPRLRPREGARAGRRRVGAGASKSPTLTIARDDAGGRDPRHRRLHGPEQARGKAVDSAPTSGRLASCSTRCSTGRARSTATTCRVTIAACREERAGLVALCQRDLPVGVRQAAEALSGERPETAPAIDRRRAARAVGDRSGSV